MLLGKEFDVSDGHAASLRSPLANHPITVQAWYTVDHNHLVEMTEGKINVGQWELGENVNVYMQRKIQL